MDEKLVEFADQMNLPLDVLVQDMQCVGIRNCTIGSVISFVCTIVAMILIIFAIVYYKGNSNKPFLERSSDHDDLYFGLVIVGGILLVISVPCFITLTVDLYNWMQHPLAMAADQIFGG